MTVSHNRNPARAVKNAMGSANGPDATPVVENAIGSANGPDATPVVENAIGSANGPDATPVVENAMGSAREHQHLARFVAIVATTLFAFSSLAAPKVHKGDDYAGSIEMGEGKVRVNWSAWFDVPAEKVVRRMKTWERSHVLQEKAVATEVRSRTKNRATLIIEREMPVFFLPNMKMTFEATSEKRKDGSTRITWVQLEGPATSAKRTWTITSRAGGTWVEHQTRVVLPFEPPAFLQENQSKRLAEQVRIARREFGATTTRRTPPDEVAIAPSPKSVPMSKGKTRDDENTHDARPK